MKYSSMNSRLAQEILGFIRIKSQSLLSILEHFYKPTAENNFLTPRLSSKTSIVIISQDSVQYLTKSVRKSLHVPGKPLEMLIKCPYYLKGFLLM